jgi:predicted Zn-dependent protease
VNKLAQAEIVLQRVLVLQPGRRVAEGNLGYVLARDGKVDTAVLHYCRYIQLSASAEQGQSALKRQMNDPDPNVQKTVERALQSCR